MKPRTLLIALAVIVAAAACVRLGFWQVSRLQEKRARNAAMSAALARPPVAIGLPLPAAGSLAGGRVALEGRFDVARQVLLTARYRNGEPGVEVVTPLVLAGDSVAVLVNRGWLYAVDGRTARPQDHPEPGPRTVLGVAEPIGASTAAVAPGRTAADSLLLLSARVLDREAMTPHFPYVLAPFVVNELPGPGVPDAPRRRAPEPLDEAMHLGYAIQWFAVAFIIVVGSGALAWSRRSRGG